MITLDDMEADALSQALQELREWLDDGAGQGSRRELDDLSERLEPIEAKIEAARWAARFGAPTPGGDHGDLAQAACGVLFLLYRGEAMTDDESPLRKQARGIAAYVRAAAEKHDGLCAQAGGVGFPTGMLHNAQAHALRVVAREIEGLYT